MKYKSYERAQQATEAKLEKARRLFTGYKELA